MRCSKVPCVLLLGAALGGCSGTSSPGSKDTLAEQSTAGSPLATPLSGAPRAGDGETVHAAVFEDEDASGSSLFNLYLFSGKSPAYVQYEVELQVQACMNAQGWDYVVSPIEPTRAFTTFRELRQFRLSYGYGISTQEPRIDDFSTEDLEAATDANLAIQRALDTGARAAYLQALVGDEVEGGPEGGQGSCRDSATSSVTSQIPFYMVEYADATDYFLQQLESDQRFITAVDDWSRCMEGKGFDYDNPDSVIGKLMQTYVTLGDDIDANAAFQTTEFAAALADIECASTELAETKRLVESEIVAEMVETGRLPALPG